MSESEVAAVEVALGEFFGCGEFVFFAFFCVRGSGEFEDEVAVISERLGEVTAVEEVVEVGGVVGWVEKDETIFGTVGF